MYRHDRGRVHKSSEYKAWVKEAGYHWLIQKRKVPVKYILGRYVLEVLVYPPDNRMRDLGNLEKALSDFLQDMGIVQNDYLSKRIVFEWADPPYTDYCVEVTVTAYP